MSREDRVKKLAAGETDPQLPEKREEGLTGREPMLPSKAWRAQQFEPHNPGHLTRYHESMMDALEGEGPTNIWGMDITDEERNPHTGVHRYKGTWRFPGRWSDLSPDFPGDGTDEGRKEQLKEHLLDHIRQRTTQDMDIHDLNLDDGEWDMTFTPKRG